MKDRMYICEYYNHEGDCAKGREGTWQHYCKHCQAYKPRKTKVPARLNLKKKKMEKINKRDRDYGM